MAITTDIQTTKELRSEGAAFRSFLTDLNKPVSTELSKQILEALTTGGATERIPIISARLEAAKKANAASFGLTEDELARVGITGDPAGQRILATQRREAAFAEGQIPAGVAQELIGLAPGFIRDNQQNLTTLAGAETRETRKAEVDISQLLSTFAQLGGTDLIRNLLNSLGLGGLLGGAAQAGADGDATSLIGAIAGPLSRLGGDVLSRLQNAANALGVPTSVTGIGGLLSSVDSLLGGTPGVPSLPAAAQGADAFLSQFLGEGFGGGAELLDIFDLINPSSASAPAAGVGAAGAAASGGGSSILSTLAGLTPPGGAGLLSGTGPGRAGNLLGAGVAGIAGGPAGIIAAAIPSILGALFGFGEDIPVGESVIANISGVKLEQIDIDRAIEALNNSGRQVVSGKIETLKHPTLGSFPAIRVILERGEFGDPDTTTLIPLLQVADDFITRQPGEVKAADRRFVPGFIEAGEQNDAPTVGALFDPVGAGNFRFRDVLFSQDIPGGRGTEFANGLPVESRPGAQTIFQLTGDI